MPSFVFIGGNAALTFLQSEATQVATQTVYTFTDANIGPAAADRYVVVCITGSAGTSGRSLSSVSIGGSAATLDANAASSVPASTTSIAAIARRLVAAGTTATVVATFSADMLIGYCHVYTLTHALSATPNDTQTTVSGPGTATSLSDTIDVLQGGALLVTASSATRPATTP